MPPKKRATTVSPKKAAAARVEEADPAVIDDIESEDGGAEGVPEESSAPAAAAALTTTPSPARKRRRRGEEEEAPDVVPVENAPPPHSEVAAVDDEDQLGEIIERREEGEELEEEIIEEEELAMAKEEEEEGGEEDVLPVRQQVSSSNAKGSVIAAFLPAGAAAAAAASHREHSTMMATPNRRVPRLKMEGEPAPDVKRAQATEDDREREGVKRTRKPAAIRRPTSPPRTRGFTSAATLSATMKESKERLKRPKRGAKVGDAEAATSAPAAAEGGGEEGDVDVENDGDPVTDGNPEASNTCAICAQRFPLHLEMIEHQLAAHKKEVRHVRERGGTLMCAHPHCGLALKDMHHQLAHLAGYHNQTQFRIRQQHFPSEEAFGAWKAESESRAKAAYIARTEEVEVSPGVVELELYCECSEEWRNIDKSKSLSPMLACPAHFTVRLDRSKDKVSIIGCTSHLGHLKKPNWSVYEPSEHVLMRKGGGVIAIDSRNCKCHLCNEWFRSRTALTIHRRTAHPDKIRTATIACGDPACDVVTDTMLSLCEHVADAHKREDLTVEEYRFNSLQDFEVWKERMEADTMSYYTKVSGRQRAASSGPNSDCFFRYYQCHLSGYNQRPTSKKTPEEMERVKIRNRGTKKMNRFCTAFMNIKINDNDGSVLLKGCLGHFGHECDIRRVPMPNSLRNEIVELLQKGVTEDDVLAIIKDKASVHDRAFYLQKYEVKNIVKKMIKESNGAIFYKYDDEIDEVDEEDEHADWQEMKRPFSSSMYRSMLNHPKRRSLGSYALQFTTQQPRKRRLVYRQGGHHTMHHSEYYESVEEAIPDMDEHVTYLEEGEMDPSSSHHHMVQESGEHHEDGQHRHVHAHDMQEEMANEASTSAAAALHHARRRKQQQLHQMMQHPMGGGVASRTPLLKDGSEQIPHMARDRNVELTIYNIRKRIMIMTEQVKRCKDPHQSQQMLEEVRSLETRMARIIPQTGPARLDQSLPPAPYIRGGRHVVDEEEDDEEGEEMEYYEEELVVDGSEDYYDMEDDGGRPGPSTMIVQRGGQRGDGGGYGGHHQVMYQDVGSPGVEVDVEDLEEMEEEEGIDQMNV